MICLTWGLLAASIAAAPPNPGALQRMAMERQRTSVRKQAESLGLRMQPGSPAPPPSSGPVYDPPACDPIADTVVTPLIESAAKEQNLETNVIRAVIEQESAYHACAISPRGAEGLMQLMPETATQLGVHDPFDPKENIEAGAKYLRQLLDKYKGDMAQALGAYNAGPSTVDQSGGVPAIPETKDYVDAILKKLGITRTDPQSIQMPKPIGN